MKHIKLTSKAMPKNADGTPIFTHSIIRKIQEAHGKYGNNDL